MTHFEPVLTQDDLDDLIKKRVDRATRRIAEAENDRETWRREARKWERLAKKNLDEIRTLEKTIDKFLDRFEDILEEEV